MKVSSEQIENSQVSLNIELESAETNKYMATALDNIAKRVAIPGFRKGKAPKALVEQKIGKDAIFQEALEHLIPESYEEALKIESIVAIAEPKIELIQIDPVIFKAIVPLQPRVTLGNYKDIRLEIEKREITDKDVDEVIEQIRNHMGTLEPVDREIQSGDVVSIDIECKRDTEPFLSRKDALYEVREGSEYPVPGFSEKLINHNKGEEMDFSISFPHDYEVEDLSGKQFHFWIKINEVKTKNLPPVDDEFARNAGNENVEDLRNSIKSDLQIRVDERSRKLFEDKLINSLIEKCSVEFPPILVEKEIDHMLEEEARNFPDGMKGLEVYLKNIKKTYQQHREDLRHSATDRVEAYLILNKIAETEGIDVSEEELNEAVAKMAGNDEKRLADLKDIFVLPRQRESLKEMIVIDKTIKLLTQIATSSSE